MNQQTCFILGGGPSLQGFNYSLIKDFTVIGTNRAFEFFPETTYNYIMDFSFYRAIIQGQHKIGDNLQTYQKWCAYRGTKVLAEPSSKEGSIDASIRQIKRLPYNAISFDVSKGITTGNNSGFGAMMLAVALGFKIIGLLGFDMKLDKEKTNYHRGYPRSTVNRIQANLNAFKGVFNTVAPALKAQKIHVFNLFRGSELTCFPKLELEEFLARVG